MDLFSVMYLFFVHCHTKRFFPCHKKIFSLSRIIFCPLSQQKILSLSQKDLFIVTYYFLFTVTLKDLFSCSKNISFMSHIYFSFQSHRSVWGPYSKKKFWVIFSPSPASADIFTASAAIWSLQNGNFLSRCISEVSSGAHCWWWCWALFSGSSAHFQIWKVWLCSMKNSNKIAKKSEKIGEKMGDGWWLCWALCSGSSTHFQIWKV